MSKSLICIFLLVVLALVVPLVSFIAHAEDTADLTNLPQEEFTIPDSNEPDAVLEEATPAPEEIIPIPEGITSPIEASIVPLITDLIQDELVSTPEHPSISFDQAKTRIVTIFQNLKDFVKNAVISDPVEYEHRKLNNSSENHSIREENAPTTYEQTVVQDQDYVPDEILIKYKDDKIDLDTASGRVKAMNVIASKSLEKQEYLKEDNIAVVKITDEDTVEQKITELENNPNVEYATPNFKYATTDINTDDADRALLWNLDNTGQDVNGIVGTPDADIDAPEAWAVNEGTNASVIVAVIDTGVAYNHPDLNANMWDGTNCLDENGFVVVGGCNYGYDFEDNDNDPLPTNPFIGFHGTHVAGIIGAVKNNGVGVIGVAPNVKIMALKSSLTTDEIIRAIHFAEQNGAKIINASWGGYFFDQPLYDAISEFTSLGGVFVAAAGNDATDNDTDFHLYPSDFDIDNIISVAATDSNDGLAYFSSYGATSVDVGAPGANIYSTIYNTTATEETLLNETFDELTAPAIPAGWVLGGTNNNWGTYHFDRGFFMGNVLYGDVNNLPYVPTADSTITSPTLDLSGDAVKLDFSTECDTEYQFDWTDYMSLEVSDDGGNTFTEILRWDELELDIFNGDFSFDSDGGSTYHFRDLFIPDQYLNSNFQYRFRWIANGDTDTGGGEGCSINNVKFTKITYNSSLTYDYLSGTSMAAPHVTGLAALLWGYQPNLTSTEVKQAILDNGDSIPALNGKTVSGKRINAFNTLSNFIVTPVPPPSATDTTPPVITLIGNGTMKLVPGQTFVDPGATATDDVDGDITSNIIVGGDTVNTSEVGTYVITYNVSDAANNSAQEVTRTVIVSVPVHRHSGGGGGGQQYIPLSLSSDGCAPGNLFSATTGTSCGSVLGAETFHFTLLLKNGFKGTEVMELQKFLNQKGYTCSIADGIFGQKTQSCVTNFQIANGIVGTGVVGPLTRAALNK